MFANWRRRRQITKKIHFLKTINKTTVIRSRHTSWKTRTVGCRKLLCISDRNENEIACWLTEKRRIHNNCIWMQWCIIKCEEQTRSERSMQNKDNRVCYGNEKSSFFSEYYFLSTLLFPAQERTQSIQLPNSPTHVDPKFVVKLSILTVCLFMFFNKLKCWTQLLRLEFTIF